MTFVVGKLRASQLQDLINLNSPLSLGITARARRESNSTTTTTEVGVLRLDDVPIYLGRTWIVKTGALHVDGSVANDVIGAKLRYTTDGTTPTTASTVLASSQELQDNTSLGVDLQMLVTYTPAADETLSILLTVSRISGTGTVGMLADSTRPNEIIVLDAGLDVGDTGVDI